MPVIDHAGEKKKVACGPCIRGHRSSKCQHSDRVLIEVRKPGRPLSACPHPSGSCSCQRAVFYTVPKNDTSPVPSGTGSPATGAYNPAASLPLNRIQKSKLRKNSTNVTPSTIQRAFESDPLVLAHHMNQPNDGSIITEESESSSNVPSLASSTSSTPQTEAIDMGVQTRHAMDGITQDLQGRSDRLQLGMMGIGGYRTRADEVGWTGEWPDYNSIPPTPAQTMTEPPRSCCAPAPPAEPKQTPAPGSCCAPKTQPAIRHSASIAQQYNSRLPDFQTGRLAMPPSMDLNYRDQFTLPNPAYNQMDHQSNEDFFGQSEDRFGCTHDPDRSCECGDGCECLGCAVHPANRVTTDYVRYHTELSLKGFIDPSRMQMPPPGYAPNQSFPGSHAQHNLRNVNTPMLPHHNQFNHPGYATQSPYSQPWQPNQHPLSTPTLELQQFNLRSTLPPTRPEIPLQTPRTPRDEPRQPVRQQSMYDDHESPSTEDDASTLSPSAFSVQQFNIPGCNDVTGSCLCGDGCQCEGCLTHSGHGNAASDERIAEVLDRGAVQFNDVLGDPLFPTTVPG